MYGYMSSPLYIVCDVDKPVESIFDTCSSFRHLFGDIRKMLSDARPNAVVPCRDSENVR
jgi:hypothetical protein